MPELSLSAIAFIKLLSTFGCMLIMLRMHVALWKAIFTGCALLALLCGLPVSAWVEVPLATLGQTDFLAMQAMLFGILILSGLQDSSGQSRRLVEQLERYVRWPKVRLVLFPALVGLLPMPGGALFSCPMLEATAHNMPVDGRRKTLINYWFRHIWEPAWPLYPGYILACSLLGVPLLTLMKYTFPLVIFSLLTGWFFYLRDIKSDDVRGAVDATLSPSHGADTKVQPASLAGVLAEALPLIITLAGAGVFAVILDAAAPEAPPQLSFILSLSLAIGMALYQSRGLLTIPLRRIAFNAGLFRMLLLIFAVFVFKDVIAAGGLIEEMSHMGENSLLVYALFIILPILCGLLTGVMVGFVGACFPILIGIMMQTGMQDQALPLAVVAFTSGHAGQLLSPLHVCLVMSCEYFRSTFASVWKKLVAPVIVQILYGIAWAGVLFGLGASL